jgi:hypothetical protein
MNREQWEIKRERHPEVEPLAGGAECGEGAEGTEGPKRQRRNVSECRKKKKLVAVNKMASMNR